MSSTLANAHEQTVQLDLQQVSSALLAFDIFFLSWDL